MVSDAAVKLTTGMLKETASQPAIGRAEALRRSMLALMGDREKPFYAHPMFWAPFVVVGEAVCCEPISVRLRQGFGGHSYA